VRDQRHRVSSKACPTARSPGYPTHRARRTIAQKYAPEPTRLNLDCSAARHSKTFNGFFAKRTAHTPRIRTLVQLAAWARTEYNRFCSTVTGSSKFLPHRHPDLDAIETKRIGSTSSRRTGQQNPSRFGERPVGVRWGQARFAISRMVLALAGDLSNSRGATLNRRSVTKIVTTRLGAAALPHQQRATRRFGGRQWKRDEGSNSEFGRGRGLA